LSLVTLYYSIALPIPVRRLFTYVMAADRPPAPLGARVLVPFGKRVMTGVVVACDVEPVADVKQVIEVLDDVAALPPSILDLTRFLAEYYMCSWGEAIQAALPSGLTPQSVVRVELLRDVTEEDLATMGRRAPKRAALLGTLVRHSGDVSVAYLQQKLKSTTIADQLQALQHAGWVRITNSVDEQHAPKTQVGVMISESLASMETALREAFDLLDAKAPKQSVLLGQLYLARHAGHGPVLRTALLSETGASASALDGLIKRGFAEVRDVVVQRTEAHSTVIGSSKDESTVELTTEQAVAVDAIVEGMRSGTYRPFLLDGVTGSGKTIVYQRAIAHALEQGRSALLLVPEISLTPQLMDRFRIVFGDRVAVLHSRMGVGERTDTWRAIRNGERPLVIGPRSALFAPLERCGLIIVDEEHEPSYKQDDPAPRYHGRDAALMRASLEQCVVVLGTATPSVETRFAADNGKITRLQLTHRADGAAMPTVRVVDLREARKSGQLHGSYTRDLLESIQERIERKEGTILFLNRRGFASQLQCMDCGDVPMCKNCDVALTYHKASFALRCHYCGYAEPARTMCLVCGSVDLKEAGSGTQRVEEELVSYLQGRDVQAVVHRMDIDSTQRKGSHRAILQRFAQGEIDVLIGTQMIAKGLDIGRVTLVGVINADAQLHHSDFRAGERTVQLLTQVAGRSGRTGARPGEVIIQTSSPDHPAIQASVHLQLEPWYRVELTSRHEAHYPPYTRFIVVECSGLDEATVAQHASVLAQLLPAATDHFTRLDPVAPPIPRMRNRFRQVIVIKNDKTADPSGKYCRAHLQAALDTYQAKYAHSSVRVTVDVDASGAF
jgi:primosomal protein N' (replication factor Y)